MPEIYPPFAYEVAGHFLIDRESEEIRHLCREDSHRDTGRETHHDRIWYELYDRSEPEKSEQHKDASGHECGKRESFETILCDDIVDDHDEGSRGASDLDSVAAESGDKKASDYGCDKTDRRSDTARYRERYGQRNGNDAHHKSSREILLEF